MRTPSNPQTWTRRRRAATIVAVALTLALGASALVAQTLSVSTENDIFTRNPTKDDLYSFSLGFEIDRGATTFALFERAFTDRAAGLRFDETYLEARRDVAAPRGWNLRLGGGVVRVGNGLFGERLQNAVHRVIGGDPVDLRYHRASWHARAVVTAERWASLGPRLEVGTRFELDAAPGLRTLVAAGAQASWRPSRRWTLETFLGARRSKGELDPLEPHLGGLSLAARLGVVVAERYLVAWSLNTHGDRREHWTVGYVVPFARAGGPAAR